MRTLRYISARIVLLVLVLTCMQSDNAPAVAQPPHGPSDNKHLRVGVIPLEPFAFHKDGKPKGISIELWEEVAKIHGRQYQYSTLPESGYLDIEPLLQKHQLDLVIGPIAITYKRINEISFSTPYYITTSNLITDNKSESFGTFLMHFIKTVFSFPIIILFFIVLICSFLIWLKERKHFPDTFPQSVYKGVPYSIWYGFHTIFAGDIFFEIKHTYSRILTVIMLLCSVILVSIGAATLTSALTLSHMGFSTKSGDLSDLRNQSVAIIGGTDVEGYLQSLNVNTVVVDSLPDAIQSLKNDKVVAVIADKLLVNSCMKQNKISNIYITDMVVRSKIVAFALPKDSVYKDRVNESIGRLQNSNWIYHMCLKYLSPHDAAFCNL